MLPGLRSEIVAARGTTGHVGRGSVAWSVAVSPAVARAIALRLELPTPDAELPSEAHRRIWAHRFGRFPGSFVQPGATTFARAMTASVSDDAALLRFVSPLFGAALFGVPRDERRIALAMLPEAVRFGALRWFETLRSTTRPASEISDVLADPFARDARWSAKTMRPLLIRRAAVVFAHLWWDELRVMSGGSLSAPAMPVALDRSRAAAQWWVTTINNASK